MRRRAASLHRSCSRPARATVGPMAFSAEPPPQEQVTVLRAQGRVFCAGLDLRRRLPEDPSSWAGESPVEECFAAVETYALPVVAVVQGDAIAGGCELALHCDLVVASTRANFGMSLAQVGLAPTWFLAKKLLEVAGPVATREILLLGDPLPATRLHELSMISRVVPPHRLESEVNAVVARVAANAPLSLRATKALLYHEVQHRDAIGHHAEDARRHRPGCRLTPGKVSPPASRSASRPSRAHEHLGAVHEPLLSLTAVSCVAYPATSACSSWLGTNSL